MYHRPSLRTRHATDSPPDKFHRLRPRAESNFLICRFGFFFSKALICILLIKLLPQTRNERAAAFIHSSGWRFSAAFKIESKNTKVSELHYKEITLRFVLTSLISIGIYACNYSRPPDTLHELWMLSIFLFPVELPWTDNDEVAPTPRLTVKLRAVC